MRARAASTTRRQTPADGTPTQGAAASARSPARKSLAEAGQVGAEARRARGVMAPLHHKASQSRSALRGLIRPSRARPPHARPSHGVGLRVAAFRALEFPALVAIAAGRHRTPVGKLHRRPAFHALRRGRAGTRRPVAKGVRQRLSLPIDSCCIRTRNPRPAPSERRSDIRRKPRIPFRRSAAATRHCEPVGKIGLAGRGNTPPLIRLPLHRQRGARQRRPQEGDLR